MNLSLSDVLELTKTEITSVLGEEVTLGMPDSSGSGLFLFPYQLLFDPVFVNDRHKMDENVTSQRYILKCLMVPGSSQNYEILSKAFDSLVSIQSSKLAEQITLMALSNVTTEDLCRIFSSAGVSFRLSIPFELRWAV